MLGLVARALRALLDTLILRARRGPARPSWSFRFQWMIATLKRDNIATQHWPIPRQRAHEAHFAVPSGALAQVRRREESIEGVPCAWFEPPAVGANRAFVYFHGGSYLFGSTRTHGDIIARLALAAGARILAVEYRLAPEHPYPAQQEDALAAVRGLATRGLPAERLVLAGDSAGASLALATQLALRDRGDRQAAAAILLSPWLDLTESYPSSTENDPLDWGTRELVLGHARIYAGTIPLDDPRLSLIGAKLEGLAPLFVQVGEVERRRDEGAELCRRATAAGVEATLDLVPDMPHVPALFAAQAPEGARALERAAAFADRWLGSG